MPRMEDKSVQTLLNIKEEPKSSLEEEWVPPDPRNSFQNPVAVNKETEEKWSVPRLRDKTPCVKVESFEDPVTIKRKLKSSAEKRRIPPGPRKSRKLHMKVESFEDPVTLKRKAEPSPEEEWISTDPGESTLLMDVVEESFEDVTSPAQGDSKEKSETDENEKEAVEESQDRDCDTVYISSEGTYLPKTPSPEGDPDESERSPPQLSEFERSFLQHLCHTKAEKGPAREVHQCPDCGKTFNFSANLKMHQRFHVKEKPFECLECGRHFTYKSNLESHQIIHSGEKPFRCDECGRYFSYSWTLQKHQKFHEARRGFGEPRGVSSWMGPRNSYNGGAV
nr:PREDICTED: zinc finger protein 283 [Anolis carolinensis]|eukprot:XP_008123168.2 PREDICTED: zinc finger protein 283 [Anolis carolinensis]